MDNNDDFTQEVYDDEFVIRLTIEGTEYDEVEVNVADPNKTIRDTIASIVQVFNLPKMDGGGIPQEYRLGRINDDDEIEVLFPEDDHGLEMSLVDYDIQPNDMLQLVKIPIAG